MTQFLQVNNKILSCSVYVLLNTRFCPREREVTCTSAGEKGLCCSPLWPKCGLVKGRPGVSLPGVETKLEQLRRWRPTRKEQDLRFDGEW